MEIFSFFVCEKIRTGVTTRFLQAGLDQVGAH